MSSHGCTTLLLRCIDYRLEPKIQEFLKDRNLVGDCDIVSLAGAAKNFTSLESTILGHIELAKNLHGIKQVILMNHTNCGAYRDHTFNSTAEEIQFHKEELQNAKAKVQKAFPDIDVKLALAHIIEPGKIEIKTI